LKIDLSKLRELREEAGFTRKELSNIIGCTELTLLRWESGRIKKPLLPYRERLEKFYLETLIK